MKKFLFFLPLFFASYVLFAQLPVIVTAKKINTSRSENNYSLPASDVLKQKPDASKSACCLSINNLTGYFVDLWINSDYMARINPYGNTSVCMGDMMVKWYAKTLGNTFEWSGESACWGEFAINISENDY